MSEIDLSGTVLTKLDNMSALLARVDAKVDQIQRQQNELSNKIVALETWKAHLALEDKFQLLNNHTTTLATISEKITAIESLKAQVATLTQKQWYWAGGAGAAGALLIFIANVLIRLIH